MVNSRSSSILLGCIFNINIFSSQSNNMNTKSQVACTKANSSGDAY